MSTTINRRAVLAGAPAVAAAAAMPAASAALADDSAIFGMIEEWRRVGAAEVAATSAAEESEHRGLDDRPLWQEVDRLSAIERELFHRIMETRVTSPVAMLAKIDMYDDESLTDDTVASVYDDLRALAGVVS